MTTETWVGWMTVLPDEAVGAVERDLAQQLVDVVADEDGRAGRRLRLRSNGVWRSWLLNSRSLLAKCSQTGPLTT